MTARTSIVESNVFEDDCMISSSSSASSSSPSSIDHRITPRKRFKSARLVGTLEKPWLNDPKRNKKFNWDNCVFGGCILSVLVAGCYLSYSSYSKAPKHDYCLVMEDDFKSLDLVNNWSREVQVGGFGTGSFDWTTEDDLNSFVDSNGLHIVPTITTQVTNITVDQMANGAVVNLTASGTCTTHSERIATNYIDDRNCVAVSNSTKGTIVNPVRSARLTTKGKKFIKYGRVEVVARMPRGDWLWPAIWMMPEESVYGEWPRSGEIDIAESRGNDAQLYPLGNNIITSTLHWGTSWLNDLYRLSTNEWGGVRTKYSDGMHVFGMEWSEKYISLWVDKRLREILYFEFPAPDLYSFGKISTSTVNGSIAANPWAVNGVTARNAPFDQSFYLILNVAVGSNNGWFPDGMGNKPWADNTAYAAKDFWKAQPLWEKTWGQGTDRGMTVKSVKMWQEGKCNQ